MTGSVWFTSDTHFDHKLVSGLRGFDSPTEHDAAIVETWNSLVRPGDTVWHLGDVGMGRLSRFAHHVEQLHGTIHLVTGNHDECSPIHRGAHLKQREWLGVFASVQAFARIKLVHGRRVLLSHFPYTGDHGQDRFTQYRLRDEGMPLLHGHTHSSERGDGRQVHVGLDAWELRPVRTEEVAELLGVPGPAAG
ncbi:metallophosphoesterase family protein [Amycolatopsis thermophila]|uniref:Calcineurin-like phosphoesterase family protein n=1 Tax=Amycolatopsis thermophila TaxID=206084 RepID=A0ABU0EMN7_9PSEU|nr:metallophosphoesterase family protein [Amycolatopsis thermophila]MDQ0376548.1 calcineurin-like phosphoesterase family protein [Amycolatopsis thermophila]